MLSLSLAFCHHYSLSFCTAIHYNRLPIRARTLTDSSDANSSIGISWTKYETDVLWCTRCLQWGLLAWSIRPSRIKMHPKPCFHTTVVICCWMSQNYQTMHSFSVFFTGNNNNHPSETWLPEVDQLRSKHKISLKSLMCSDFLHLVVHSSPHPLKTLPNTEALSDFTSLWPDFRPGDIFGAVDISM